MRNAISLAYEYSARRLFYSDIQRGAINSVRFDGSDHRVLLDRTYLIGSPELISFMLTISSTTFVLAE